MVFCVLKLLSRYLVGKKTPNQPPNILWYESLFEGKVITIKMIAFLGIMYLSHFISALYT